MSANNDTQSSRDPPSSAHLHLPTQSQQSLFLSMHYRKMQRDLNGPQKKKTKYHILGLSVLLVIVYGLSAYNATNHREEGGDGDGDDDASLAIVLTLGQMALIGIWIFLCIVVSSLFGSSRFVVCLYWMCIYWPLLAILASLLFHDSTKVFGDSAVGWIAHALVAAEVLTALAFAAVMHAYPKFVTSRYFLERYSARRFWNIRLVEQDVAADGRVVFGMQYDGMWGRLSERHRCRYVGSVDKEGSPHGSGVWSDDSYGGEVLAGTWEHGQPTAPFGSRQYGGKGNTFSAVKLAYFMATDDGFEANKLMPTNDMPARCGLASVECSVAGDFMSHLPEATLIGEPQVEGEEGMTIGECCRQIASYDSNSMTARPAKALQIHSNDLRGIQIDGYYYQPTGLAFTRKIKEIVIKVINSNELGYQEVQSSAADNDENSKDAPMEDTEKVPSAPKPTTLSNLHLEVKDWTRVDSRDALIFIPGFNSWLKHSLETFGQMIAMTRMGQTVIPILYAWPGGQVLTYRQASLISGSDNNRSNFLQMLRRLRDEGIQNVHIVTHSLGVQSLMAAFEDNGDGTPSAVSQCFDPAPTHGEAPSSVTTLGRLQCRSITMLNPDFNVHAFRERGFQSIRRVTSLITVVGDKADQALFWSSLINGFANWLGYSQPSMCDSKARKEERGFHLQQPIGRNIDKLYVEESMDIENKNLLLQHKDFLGASSRTIKNDAGESNKIWLDCDVIDTTGLDTNVNDLRHSAYNVNSILLRDIEELIMTRKRASERTTLLHMKGNVYQFCHAPSFVKM